MLEGRKYLLSFFSEMGVSLARTPEGKFQDKLVASLEATFPGCLIQKNDANYRQGIPDLLILFRDRWALLEVKKSAKAPARPNQAWYVDWANKCSYGSFVYPENWDAVLKELFAHFMDHSRGEN